MRQMKHDPRVCGLCDTLDPGTYCRRWKGTARVGYWHVIQDGADLMERLPPQAHFVTILRSRADPKGCPVSYRGPLYFEGVDVSAIRPEQEPHRSDTPEN
jgi:hypothetical protein